MRRIIIASVVLTALVASFFIAGRIDIAQPAYAQAKGRERFESFLETLGRRLAKGQSLLREVSIDKPNDGSTRRPETTTNA